MKLLKIEIENFGKFKNFTYTFKEGLTVIDEKNGFGKTTITEFINAMIYGMPRAKGKASLNNNLRAKYAPWQGGIYGGSLIFKFNNKEYKITRQFGTISATHDTFMLFDNLTNIQITSFNGQEVDKNNFGEVLLKVNQETYQRTNFIPENSVMYYEETNELNESVNNRLRFLLGDTSDDNNLKKATDILNKNIRALSPQKNSLYELNEREISETVQLIEEAKEAQICANEEEIKLKDLKEAKEAKEKEVLKISQTIELLNKIEANRLKLQKHEENLKTKQETEEKLTIINKIFTRKSVKETNLDLLKESLEKLNKKTIEFNEFKESKEKEINELRNLDKNEKEDNTLVILELELNQDLKQVDQLNIEKTEATNLIKPFKALDIILSVITLGIYFLVIFFKNKKQKNKINEINKKLIYLNNNIELTKNKLNELKKKDKKDYTKEIEELYKTINIEKEKLESLKNETEKLFSDYETKATVLDVSYHLIETSYNEYHLLTKRLEDIIKEINEFKEPEKFIVDDSLDLNELKTNEQTLREEILIIVKELTTTERTISDNLDIASNLDQLETLLTELQAKKVHYEKHKELLEKTINYLTTANQQLAAKYLEPLQEGVNKLIKDFSLKDLVVQFDGNSKMSVKPEGTNNYYDLGHYSSGNKDFISVLVRFSLINIIYEDINPFIILDDPFLHFDDDNIKLVKPLLERLSKKNQIIYFTCSKSRNLT